MNVKATRNRQEHIGALQTRHKPPGGRMDWRKRKLDGSVVSRHRAAPCTGRRGVIILLLVYRQATEDHSRYSDPNPNNSRFDWIKQDTCALRFADP
jgi:hypothetical protein